MKKEQIIEIPLPDTSEIEKQVIADMIASPEMLGDVIPLLHLDFFTSKPRQEEYKAIVDHYNRGQGIDLWSIGSVTGEAFMHDILPIYGSAGGTVLTVQHANILRTMAAKRRAYFAAHAFLTEVLKPATTEAEILSMTVQFTAHVEGPSRLQSDVKLSEALEDTKADLKQEEELKEQGKTVKVKTGFFFLDDTLGGGMRPGWLVILAARPSVGKTALMLQMAKHAASEGETVMIFSLEMTTQELTTRLLYGTEKVRPYEVNRVQVDWNQYAAAETELKPLPLFINDFSRQLDDIVTRLTQAVKDGRCQIAFVDYLGLMQDAVNPGDTKLYQAIAKITGTLKAVAKRLAIPIVLLCQLNRDQKRERRAPELHDLRDSGSIEQDADVVIMLDPQKDGTVWAWLRKNRNGKRDIAFTLKPNATYTVFEEDTPFVDSDEDDQDL